jgi:hypothetical protein
MRGKIALVVLLAGCGDDGSTTKKDAAIDSPNGAVDAMVDAKMIDAPPGTTPLTVKNVLAWCEVFVDGSTTGSTASSITTNVMPGAITLVARAKPGTMANNSLFKIVANMWHLTDGDTGNGETGTVNGTGDAATSTVMATVVANTPKCVWICCPFKDGSGCEPATTDQHDCP